MHLKIKWYIWPLLFWAFYSIAPIIYALLVFGICHIGPAACMVPGLELSIGTAGEYITLLAILAGANWFFGVLFLVARLSHGGLGSKVGMWTAIAILSALNIILILAAPLEFSNAHGAGQGAGLILSAMILGQPVYGSVGWLIGWLVGWLGVKFLSRRANRTGR